MEPDPRPPRNSRFKPKPQNQRRLRKSSASGTPTTGNVDDGNVNAPQRLLQHFNEPRRPQPQDAAQVHVTFSNEGKRSTKVSGSSRDGACRQSSGLDSMQLEEGVGQFSKSSSSTGTHNETGLSIQDSSENDPSLKEKTYQEPWDYMKYYPTSHPLRKHPKILNEAEFGDGSTNVEYDETQINAAAELGLLNLNPDEKPRLLFFQLPKSLPVIKRVASAKGKEKAGTSRRTSTTEDLSAGHMGKMLVYKSGAVKIRLGDTLFDVSPGTNRNFAQEVTVINTEKKEYCEIGDIQGHAGVVPDIDHILDNEMP